jgi:hypothetical protein
MLATLRAAATTKAMPGEPVLCAMSISFTPALEPIGPITPARVVRAEGS